MMRILFITLLLACKGLFVHAQNAPKSYELKISPDSVTKLQIYLLDNKGSYINKVVDVSVIDPVSKKIIKSFSRLVKKDVPIAIEIEHKDSIDISLQENWIILKGVLLEKNKLNRLYITLEASNLLFTYSNNRKRPVLNEALVIPHYNKQEPIKVKCNEKTELIPGKYSIQVIDILPPYQIVTEVALQGNTEIQLPQPGALSLTKIFGITKLNLYCERGDRFEPFYTWDLSSSTNTVLALRPGLYKLTYGIGKSKTIEFQIKSNRTTQIDFSEKTNWLVQPNAIGELIYKN